MASVYYPSSTVAWLLPSSASSKSCIRFLSSPTHTLVLLPIVPVARSTTTSPAVLCSSSQVGAAVGGTGVELTARERRQIRNERRERKMGSNNWKEEVEEKLLIKPKKRFSSWTEELNLDNLALLGPQWWVVRVSRLNGQETTERLARAFVRVHPQFDFKVYNPAVRVKRKLKNGSLSIKLKPLFPGCVFLHCVLNKEIHDFVRECDGIGGFLGSRVGNTKRQINRPRPVAEDEMDLIFIQAKEEQETIDTAFEEEEEQQQVSSESSSDNSNLKSSRSAKSKVGTRPKTSSKKSSRSSESSYSSGSSRTNTGEEDSSVRISVLSVGSNVHVLSGPFTEYTGRLKELNQKTGKATVMFMLFGRESYVDLELDQIVASDNVIDHLE